MKENIFNNQRSVMYLYGASGHARVIREVLSTQGIDVLGLIDDNPDVNEFDGLPISHSFKGLSPIIVSIGDCLARRRIVEMLGNVEFGMAIHSSAIISSDVKIGEGSVIMAGTILQPRVIVGKHTIVNTGSSVDHNCIIGDYVHIAPHCTLCGDITIGELSWIGAGTTIIQGINIGRNCFIGAGSVVIKDIPDNSLAFGNPCRVQRFLSPVK